MDALPTTYDYATGTSQKLQVDFRSNGVSRLLEFSIDLEDYMVVAQISTADDDMYFKFHDPEITVRAAIETLLRVYDFEVTGLTYDASFENFLDTSIMDLPISQASMRQIDYINA
jgi:hypothetical protein